MRDLSAARLYARSLFAQAQSKNEVRACQQGLDEMARVAKARRSVLDVLAHPFVSSDDKQKMIHSALGEYSTPLLERFLGLLVANHRFGLIHAIAAAFQEEVDRSQNVQPVQVFSAAALSDPHQRELKGKLESWLKTSVRLQVQIDPQLIGGLVIRTRDYVLDQSLKGQLKRLQEQMVS